MIYDPILKSTFVCLDIHTGTAGQSLYREHNPHSDGDSGCLYIKCRRVGEDHVRRDRQDLCGDGRGHPPGRHQPAGQHPCSFHCFREKGTRVSQTGLIPPDFPDLLLI